MKTETQLELFAKEEDTISAMEAFMKEVGVFSAWEDNKVLYLQQGEDA